jgi:hypothetical protein
MTLKHKDHPFYPRGLGSEPRKRGAELMALSASRAGTPSDNSTPVPIKDFVASKIAKAKADAEAASKGTLVNRRQGGGRTYDSNVEKHFKPSKKVDR